MSYVGGRTKFYGAALYRYRESDFRETRRQNGASPARRRSGGSPDETTGWSFDGDKIGAYTTPRLQAKTYEKMRELAISAFQKAGYPVIKARRPVDFWHETGSVVMGADPASSVVDPIGQVHGIEGLYVADASIMSSAGAVNTGLTIIALAMRTGDAILGWLTRHAASLAPAL